MTRRTKGLNQMRDYEVVYIFHPSLTEEAVNQKLEKFHPIVTRSEGAGGKRVMLLHGTYFEEGTGWLGKLRYRAFIAAILILQVTLLSALLWLPAWLLGRNRVPGYLALRLLPLCAAASLFAVYYAFLSASTAGTLGTMNWRTLAVCVASWVFLVLSVVATSRAVRSLQLPLPWTAKLHSLVAAVACYGFAMYLFQYGIIGLRTWAW